VVGIGRRSNFKYLIFKNFFGFRGALLFFLFFLYLIFFFFFLFRNRVRKKPDPPPSLAPPHLAGHPWPSKERLRRNFFIWGQAPRKRIPKTEGAETITTDCNSHTNSKKTASRTGSLKRKHQNKSTEKSNIPIDKPLVTPTIRTDPVEIKVLRL